MKIDKKVSIADVANAFVGIAVLLLSIVVAQKQFTKEPDTLLIIDQKKYNIGDFNVGAALNAVPSRDRAYMLAGPIFWRIMIYNSSDHNVSVTGYKAGFFESDGEFWEDGVGDTIFFRDNDKITNRFPFNIPPRSVAPVMVGLHVPIGFNQDLTCLTGGGSLDKINECYVDKFGQDIFGNIAKINKIGNINILRWDHEKISPNIVIQFQSGGGIEVRSPLDFYHDDVDFTEDLSSVI